MIFSKHNLWLLPTATQAAVVIARLQGAPLRNAMGARNVFALKFGAPVLFAQALRVAIAPFPRRVSVLLGVGGTLAAHRLAGLFAGPLRIGRALLPHPSRLSALHLGALLVFTLLIKKALAVGFTVRLLAARSASTAIGVVAVFARLINAEFCKWLNVLTIGASFLGYTIHVGTSTKVTADPSACYSTREGFRMPLDYTTRDALAHQEA
jgi:hypothetical protein